MRRSAASAVRFSANVLRSCSSLRVRLLERERVLLGLDLRDQVVLQDVELGARDVALGLGERGLVLGLRDRLFGLLLLHLAVEVDQLRARSARRAQLLLRIELDERVAGRHVRAGANQSRDDQRRRGLSGEPRHEDRARARRFHRAREPNRTARLDGRGRAIRSVDRRRSAMEQRPRDHRHDEPDRADPDRSLHITMVLSRHRHPRGCSFRDTLAVVTGMAARTAVQTLSELDRLARSNWPCASARKYAYGPGDQRWPVIFPRHSSRFCAT